MNISGTPGCIAIAVTLIGLYKNKLQLLVAHVILCLVLAGVKIYYGLQLLLYSSIAENLYNNKLRTLQQYFNRKLSTFDCQFD